MVHDVVSQGSGDFILKRLDFGRMEFDHVPRVEVDEVVVMAAGLLKARPPALKRVAMNGSHFFQKLHCAIDGGQGNGGIDLRGAVEDFHRVRVILRLRQDAQDNLSRPGDSHTGAAQPLLVILPFRDTFIHGRDYASERGLLQRARPALFTAVAGTITPRPITSTVGTGLLTEKALGPTLTAEAFRKDIMRPVFVQLRCEPGKTYEVADELYKREIASELYSTSGDYDLLLKVYIEDGVDVGKFINDNVANVPGIVRSLTTLTFRAF